jgi:ABC-2 type transport system ATP-binding protein
VKNIHELQAVQRKLFEVTFENKADLDAFLSSGLNIDSYKGKQVRVSVQGDYNRFVQETAKYQIRSIDMFTQNLEDIFMDYYDREGSV